MTMRKILLSGLLLLCPMLWAQQDSIALREVVVADAKWKTASRSQQVFTLTDSAAVRSGNSLVQVLQANSAIYFKENGYGMVASPSFRGTTAQQTAVVWNGININSQLNGQTDFNTIATINLDEIGVRSGGGSVLYGSSAIGGSIHLNDILVFRPHFDQELQLGYGSFASTRAAYRIRAGANKFSVKAAISRVDSDNDYPYRFGRQRGHNLNGQFYNTAFDAAIGYKINHRHSLRFYSQTYDGQRHFSASVGADARSKYRDLTARNLLEWEAFYAGFRSKVSAAFFSEQYQYFANFENPNFTTGKAETALLRYTADVRLFSKLELSVTADGNQTKGWGSDVSAHERSIGSGALMLRWKPSGKFSAEGSVRQEATGAYQSPLLFAVGSRWQTTKHYAVRANVSRNFRMPTFNDLYWEGSGNPNLRPESAYQLEVGQELQWGAFQLAATAYYMQVTDMLRWVPNSSGMWAPQNVAEVEAYGLDAQSSFAHRIGKHEIRFSAHYNYVVSHDDASELQSVYVPTHKGTASVSYNYGRFGLWYQQVYNGLVFSATDHSSWVPAYQIANAGVQCTFFKQRPLTLGLRMNNLYDQSYESMARRPMPGTHYNLDLNFKF